ncbi:hypothetical protein AK812_SmicGene32162 [Symbiodinium microadriaticum]|uniref:Uncharacterized protein n=1 Tax=Symbiodinium microadriaticum TaxID=2951 RepID=A0A1Q9CUT9_SYMMI|nr:hypothetical protein AK812_SmicGene32162 [Symbiodinium microadriaticum]
MARTMSDAELIDRAHGALHDVEVCCSYDVKSFSTADDGRDGLLPGEDHESPLDAPRKRTSGYTYDLQNASSRHE